MTEGTNFLYDLLPALGAKPDGKPQASYAQAVSQPPKSLAQNPVEQEAPVEELVAGAVQVLQARQPWCKHL